MDAIEIAGVLERDQESEGLTQDRDANPGTCNDGKSLSGYVTVELSVTESTLACLNLRRLFYFCPIMPAA